MSEENTLDPVELATEITIAWLNNPNNRVSADDVPAFFRAIHATVNDLSANSGSDGTETATPDVQPAVSVRRSLASKDHILSLIDGKPYKTLTRHLTGHGMTPAQYRERFGLKSDYPMVAENYAARRRELAKSIGLGRKRPVKTDAGTPPENGTAQGNDGAKPKAAARTAAGKPKAAPKAKADGKSAPADA